MTTDQKGEIAELQVLLRAAQKGWIASRTVKGSRYDVVLDDGEKLYRAQVKYADAAPSHSDGCVLARLEMGNRNNKRTTYTREEIDVVLVYVPKTNQICWVEPDVFEGKKMISLRYEPSKNGQTKGVLMTSDCVW